MPNYLIQFTTIHLVILKGPMNSSYMWEDMHAMTGASACVGSVC